MAKTFEDSIPAFVDKMAKLSMEDVLLTKNRDKYIQEEIKSKVDIGNKELTDSEYNTSYFNKAIKQRKKQLKEAAFQKNREAVEAANPLGARSGRATMNEGGEMDQQMDMLMGMEQEQPMLPDEEMEEDYVDYVVEETLSNEDRNYLIDALEKDDRLSEIFDQVVESATEFTGSGTVEGPGTGRSDSIPARLSDGEFVFTAKATEEIGADNLMSMMKDAEAAVDERQQMANGGEMEEEETIYKAQPEPQTQDIRVTKETVGREAMMKEEEDLVGDELKKSMLSTRPYVRS